MTEEDLIKMGLEKQPDGRWAKTTSVNTNDLGAEDAGNISMRYPIKDLGRIRLYLKPLSVNDAYKGRRFITIKKKIFDKECFALLPGEYKMPPPPYQIYFKFGFSSKLSDWDNPIKSCQDAIAKKYKFNDKLIRRGVVETEIVPRGKEYFEFKIEHYA